MVASCSNSRKATSVVKKTTIKSNVVLRKKIAPYYIDTKNTRADELVSFAESLKGTAYKYGGSSKSTGFDCSGFIWYVFKHFSISVPRISADFTNAGNEVSFELSKRGDIILFTGSDPNSGVVGHMGIITKNNRNGVSFIHSASGNGKGVMISGMSEYFITRFVKVIRIFSDIN